ncbi:hypothetical protein SUGI_0173350 [Cryptomeria japonica]|nr:hypothetical protein SUGI_0173350 [Cryptomeria japonica]
MLKAVLGAIPIYVLSCLRITKSAEQDTNKIMRHFLWEGSNDTKRLPLLSWDTFPSLQDIAELAKFNLRMDVLGHLQVVDMLLASPNGDVEWRWDKLNVLDGWIERIWQKLDKLESSINHVYREANMVADYLANAAIDGSAQKLVSNDCSVWPNLDKHIFQDQALF